MTPKYPHILVELTDMEGNAFIILGRCKDAARDSGLAPEEVATFIAEATSGDYEHLLQTTMRWFSVF